MSGINWNWRTNCFYPYFYYPNGTKIPLTIYEKWLVCASGARKIVTDSLEFKDPSLTSSIYMSGEQYGHIVSACKALEQYKLDMDTAKETTDALILDPNINARRICFDLVFGKLFSGGPCACSTSETLKQFVEKRIQLPRVLQVRISITYFLSIAMILLYICFLIGESCVPTGIKVT